MILLQLEFGVCRTIRSFLALLRQIEFDRVGFRSNIIELRKRVGGSKALLEQCEIDASPMPHAIQVRLEGAIKRQLG